MRWQEKWSGWGLGLETSGVPTCHFRAGMSGMWVNHACLSFSIPKWGDDRKLLGTLGIKQVFRCEDLAHDNKGQSRHPGNRALTIGCGIVGSP